MNQPFFSIIVPVYNVEQYLKQCLDSILSQSFQDFELILINDGSSDNSLSICEEYAVLFDKIVLVNQTNKGVSAARNQGLSLAKGEYIWFVDADDWIENDALRAIENNLSENIGVDIVGINCFHFHTDGILKIIINKESQKKSRIDFFSENRIGFTPWINILRTKFLIDNKIKFNESLIIYEDNSFVFECIRFAKNLSYIDSNLYFYRASDINRLSNKGEDLNVKINGNLILLNQLTEYRKSDNQLLNYWCEQEYNFQINIYYLLLNNKGLIESDSIYRELRKNNFQIIKTDKSAVKMLKIVHNLCFPVYLYILRSKII